MRIFRKITEWAWNVFRGFLYFVSSFRARKDLGSGEEITRRMILYHYAKICIGKDMAPLEDEYGCAEAVNNIVQRSLAIPVGGGLSTRYMQREFTWSKRFWKVSSFNPVENPGAALPGDIVISATGYGGTPKVPVGHVGIISADKKIMSNNSFNGKWEENYTLSSWYFRYVVDGKFPMNVYRIIG